MRLPRTVCLGLLGMVVLAGCQTARNTIPESQAKTIFWPPPPDEARIAYVQSVRQPADWGIKQSGFGHFLGRLFGASQHEQLVKPFGIALDDNNNLCLTDTGSPAVIYYDRQHKKWQRWDHLGKLRFVAPTAVARTNDVLFVADPGLGQVIAFDPAGKVRWTSGKELTHPAALVIVDGQLFVADAHQHRVAVFDLAGKFQTAFGKRGINPGEFNYPTHIAANRDGDLFVTDSMNSRIQIFTNTGRFKQAIGSAGDRPGFFSRPKGVAVDSVGHVYVVDANFDNFQIFDQQGRVLLDVGSGGPELGQFWLPNGIAISRQNEIFVTDTYNKRVQIFKYVGNHD